MGAVRCDICMGEEVEVTESPVLSPLLHKHLGIPLDNVFSCEGCSQLLNLWDEFSREARINLKGRQPQAEVPQSSFATERNTSSISDTGLHTQAGESHFKATCDLCMDAFTCDQSFNQHIQDTHNLSECVLFTHKYIIANTLENESKIKKFVDFSLPVESVSAVLECEYCDATYTCNDKLQTHLAEFHAIDVDKGDVDEVQPSGTVCSICNNEFPTYNSLAHHLMVRHIPTKSSLYFCPLCNKSFKWKNNIRSHIDSVHFSRSAKVQCSYCSQIYSSSRILKSHIEKVHLKVTKRKLSGIRYTCEFCQATVIGRLNLKRHIKFNHVHVSIDGKAMCMYCKKKFFTTKSLKVHIYKYHPDLSTHVPVDKYESVPNSCKYCHTVFTTEDKFVFHMTNMHPYPELERCNSKETCDPATRNTFDKEEEEETMQTVSCNSQETLNTSGEVDNFDYLLEEGCYYCNYCHKSSPSSSTLKNHLYKFHMIVSPIIKPTVKELQHENDVLMNDQVDHNFDGNVSSDNAMDISSSKLGEYRCKMCSFESVLAEDYIEHLSYHIKREKIVFTLPPSYLGLQMKEENDDDSYFPCSECSDTFTCGVDLLDHSNKYHGDVTEFTCKICRKWFTTVLGLAVHLKVHMSKSPSEYTCDVCQKELSSRHGLVLHKKYVHAGAASTSSADNTVPSQIETPAAFVCKFCEEEFTNEQTFITHLKDHVKEM